MNDELQEKRIMVENLFHLSLIKTLTVLPPREWAENTNSAIEVKLLVPKEVIGALQKFREIINKGSKVDFDDVLGWFLTDCVIHGLCHKVQQMEEDK